jgi:hypothetical protein
MCEEGVHGPFCGQVCLRRLDEMRWEPECTTELRFRSVDLKLETSGLAFSFLFACFFLAIRDFSLLLDFYVT